MNGWHILLTLLHESSRARSHDLVVGSPMRHCPTNRAILCLVTYAHLSGVIDFFYYVSLIFFVPNIFSYLIHQIPLYHEIHILGLFSICFNGIIIINREIFVWCSTVWNMYKNSTHPNGYELWMCCIQYNLEHTHMSNCTSDISNTSFECCCYYVFST